MSELKRLYDNYHEYRKALDIARAENRLPPYVLEQVWGEQASPSVSYAPTVRGICRHELEVIAKEDYYGTPCGCEGKWLRQCVVHGHCTRSVHRPDVECCIDCEEFECV
jgi:hypothetical protein